MLFTTDETHPTNERRCRYRLARRRGGQGSSPYAAGDCLVNPAQAALHCLLPDVKALYAVTVIDKRLPPTILLPVAS